MNNGSKRLLDDEGMFSETYLYILFVFYDVRNKVKVNKHALQFGEPRKTNVSNINDTQRHMLREEGATVKQPSI